MEYGLVASGLLVGLILGATGMGGGLIMTPLLIFGFGIEPVRAVGVDLIFAALTKAFGAWQHWQQKTVDVVLLKRAAIGSVPGTLLGVFVLKWIKRAGGASLSHFISETLGCVFVLIALVMILQQLRFKQRNRLDSAKEMNSTVISVIGFIVGFLVAITSVGSGTLFVALFVFLYPSMSARLVGTDIVHGLLITGMAGIGHAMMGTVDMGLLGNLLVGSIPGVLLGSKLSVKLPEKWIRYGLLCLLIVSAVKLF